MSFIRQSGEEGSELVTQDVKLSDALLESVPYGIGNTLGCPLLDDGVFDPFPSLFLSFSLEDPLPELQERPFEGEIVVILNRTPSRSGRDGGKEDPQIGLRLTLQVTNEVSPERCRDEVVSAGLAETIVAGRSEGSWRRSGGLRFLVHLCPRSESSPNQQRLGEGPRGAGGPAKDHRDPEEWERRSYIRDPTDPA